MTNRQFKQFVDAGGYQQQRYWTEPFVDERGRSLTLAEAMALFRDQTGRPGPASWELGGFPDGQADFPVTGVSWYEAAAYAAFAGKSLPTAFQWKGAVAQGTFAANFTDMLDVSNFGLKGPVRIGTRDAINAYGAADMAGNVKEWCWNEAEGGRMILGGGFDEPAYMYNDLDAQAPIRRLRSYGLRLAKPLTPQPAESYARIERASRDYSRSKPLDDNAFAVLKNLYVYDPQPLDARVEGTEDGPAWRKETVSFAAAYGGERIPAYLYLPTSATPPYQTVVYFPGGDAPFLPSSRNLRLFTVDFVIRSGRAVVFPVYKGTYERRVSTTGVNGFRDLMIARGKDFSRVLDYIATRPDLDKDRVGFYGLSLGAFAGQIFTAIDPRVKASVLLGGGLPLSPVPAEIDMINFVPRITVPTLMVNGRNDFSFPLKESQLPLFDHLTLPPARKRHALFEGGHLPGNLNDVIREILDWFDTYLGPLRTAP